MKKLISLILVIVVMATSISAIAARPVPEYSTECVSSCKGDCEYSPMIIVPGIMQSQVYIQDENGNDLLNQQGFPIVEGMDLQFMFDLDAMSAELPSLILPFVMSVIKRDRDIVLDKAVEIFGNSFSSHYFNPDSTRVNPDSLDEYWYSYEVAKTKQERSYGYAQSYNKDENGNTLPSYRYETEYDIIKSKIDTTGYCELAGYDHAYFYAYSSFGDTFEIAERLDEYVQMVKAQTGHDKVSLVFVSLGGTIGNVYLSEFCNPDDIDRAIFAAAATDGTYLLSDLMKSDLSFEDRDMFYSEMLPLLMELVGEGKGWMGYLLNFATRLIPNAVFTDLFDHVLNRLIREVLNNLVTNCPSMWALVPSSEYEALAAEFISDEAHALLKAKTDAYYEIQKNAKSTIQKLDSEGMDIFTICAYNLAFPSLIENWYYSSDNIVTASSASIGATFSRFGETLADDYTPSIDESYISPEREVDAGTAALPDRTWFIRNQSHLKLAQSTQDVLALCIKIVTDKNLTDARENNGGYAQFNSYRDTRSLRNMMNNYENADPELVAALSAESLADLEAAFTNAKNVYNSLTWDYDETKAAEAMLYTALYNNSLLENMEAQESPFKKYQLSGILTKVFKAASNVMMCVYGGRDYYTPWFLM